MNLYYPAIARITISLLATLSLAGSSPRIPAGYTPQPGDIVFQSFPPNPLTIAIEGCTHSPLSHCGIVTTKPRAKGKGTEWVVLEAVGPVKETALGDWIRRGRDHHLAVFRLQGELAGKIPHILGAATRYSGRPYDSRFRWDDQTIYCSELVHKAVRDATGTELGKMEKLGSLNWKPHEATIRALENGEPPLDRQMITPVALTRDPRLKLTFLSGYRLDGNSICSP